MPAIKWNQRKMSRLASLPVTVGITNRAVVTWCIDPLRSSILQIAASPRRRLGGVPKTGYGWIRRQVCSCWHNDVNWGPIPQHGFIRSRVPFLGEAQRPCPVRFLEIPLVANRPVVGHPFFIFLLSLWAENLAVLRASVKPGSFVAIPVTFG